MPKIEYSFNPFELVDPGFDTDKMPRAKKSEMLDQIADFILDSVREDCESLKSPVDGSKFPKLSPEYKAKKKKLGGSGNPDLELTGSMLNGIKTKSSASTDEVKIYVTGRQNQLKADNHNKFSSESKGTSVPARKFIPNDDEDETFRPGILRGIKSIVSEFMDEELE
jgi:hypothetical protein